MRHPSVKTLKELAEVADNGVTGLRIRKVLDGRTPLTRENGFLGGDMKLAKLCIIDKLIGNHGVEFIKFECQRDNYHDPDGFEFSNTGDTYASTLVLYKGRFRVTSWGDMVEGHEKRCSKCQKRSREEM